jgi:phosphomannomutase
MSIYKAYDVRGIYKEELDELDAYLIGYYLIKLKGIREIKIAHDTRLSSESLSKFLLEGLTKANCNVTFLSYSSTPNFYYSLFSGSDNGIMITASHNSKEYNGFKFIIHKKSFDARNGLLELEKLVKEDKDNLKENFNQIKEELSSFSKEEYIKIKDITLSPNLDNYISFLKELIELKLPPTYRRFLYEKELNIGVDFSSGMSSLALKKAFEALNISLTYYNDKLDGDFPSHEPDPSKAKDYIKSLEGNFDFLVAFDGDGDRIGIFDENKNIVLNDYLIALFINYFSQGHNNFVSDLRVSKSVIDLAKKNNLNLELIRVGRAFYKDYMDEVDCVFGAELTGHLFFNNFQNFDNPDIAFIYILEIYIKNKMSNFEFKFSDLFKEFKTYKRYPETNIKVNDADKLMKYLETNNKANIVSKLDGLSFDFGNYWYNIRKSNTESLVRINFESKKDESEDVFNSLINKIRSF